MNWYGQINYNLCYSVITLIHPLGITQLMSLLSNSMDLIKVSVEWLARAARATAGVRRGGERAVGGGGSAVLFASLGKQTAPDLINIIQFSFDPPPRLLCTGILKEVIL